MCIRDRTYTVVNYSKKSRFSSFKAYSNHYSSVDICEYNTGQSYEFGLSFIKENSSLNEFADPSVEAPKMRSSNKDLTNS